MNLAFAKKKGTRHGRVHAAALPTGQATVCGLSTDRDDLVETDKPVDCKKCLGKTARDHRYTGGTSS